MRHRRCPCCSKPRFILSAFTEFWWVVGVPDKVITFWMWEMTPIPCGFPSWRQYLEGAVLFAKVAFGGMKP